MKQDVLDDCLGRSAATRNRKALRNWRQAGAQMVEPGINDLHSWRSGSAGAWVEIFGRNFSTATQEQLRLFEACITVGPRFVPAARVGEIEAQCIISAMGDDDDQDLRIERGVRTRRPFTCRVLPQEMRPPVLYGEEHDDLGGNPTSDDGPLPEYEDG